MAVSVLNRNLSRVILHTRYIRDIVPLFIATLRCTEMTQEERIYGILRINNI